MGVGGLFSKRGELFSKRGVGEMIYK